MMDLRASLHENHLRQLLKPQLEYGEGMREHKRRRKKRKLKEHKREREGKKTREA